MVGRRSVRTSGVRTSGRWALATVFVAAFLVCSGVATATDPIATIEVVPPVTLNPDGSVTVTVSATCAPLDQYKGLPPLAEVIVTQTAGRADVRGSFGAVALCDNTPHEYEIRVAPNEDAARFHAGPVDVVAVISGCGFLDGALVCEQQIPPAHAEIFIVHRVRATG